MMVQPEARLSRQIQKAIKEKGAWCYKVWGNEMTPAGIPDIVGVYKGQFLGVEVKTATGNLSDIQRYRIAVMRQHGAMVVVARSVGDALQMLSHFDLWHAEGIHPGPCRYLDPKGEDVTA